jgi:hypothetical protein
MHKIGIIYEKEVTFHIPYYTKPIQFQSVGFLQEISYSPAPIQEKILNSNIVIELAIWKINVLIFILVSIVERIIILHKCSNARNMQE